MCGGAGDQLLKGVSRSFYLSLRLLPEEMRGGASLGYLLARTSDTLADAAGVPVEARLLYLDWFEGTLSGKEPPPRWPSSLLNALADPRERRLLEETGALFSRIGAMPAAEAALVSDVVATIISGQRLDLERFAGAMPGEPVALEDDGALDDYAWRVAGCVGEFWTRLGFLTMGGRFSTESENLLAGWGITYGKGLQLVNILRDLPADLSMGRCYLPVADVHDSALLSAEQGKWLERAGLWVEAGFRYAEALRSRRLRVATVLPAMIARETLARLRVADWQALQRGVKVPRSRVYLAMLRAFAGFRR